MTKNELLNILIGKLNKYETGYNRNIDVLKNLNNGKCLAHTLELREQETINTCKTLMESGFNSSYDYPSDKYNVYQLCLEYVVMESIYIKNNKADFNTETIIFEFKDTSGSEEPLKEAIQVYNKILKDYRFTVGHTEKAEKGEN